MGKGARWGLREGGEGKGVEGVGCSDFPIEPPTSCDIQRCRPGSASLVSLERGGPERGPGASVSGRGTPTLSKNPISAEHVRAAQGKEELTCTEGWGHSEAQEVLEDGQAHEEATVARPHLSDGLAPPKAQEI